MSPRTARRTTLAATRRRLLGLEDLGREGIVALLDEALLLEQADYRGSELRGCIVGLFMFQASTRTRLGFAAATARLGGTPLELHETKCQSGMAAAESVEDAARAIGSYCDLLAMRHDDADLVFRVADIVRVPFVNAGAGHQSHPSQALIDLFAVRKRLGGLESLRIGIAGDLATSRTAHSLLQGLSWFKPAEVRLMHPPGRGARPGALDGLQRGQVTTRDALDASGLDVLYMAGMPPGSGRSRLPDTVRRRFVLTPERIAALPVHGIALCALPRTGDISESVDSDPRAGYFAQSESGLFVRMAILRHLLQCGGTRRGADGPCLPGKKTRPDWRQKG